MFNELAREIHDWSRKQGFYDREWIGGATIRHNPSLASEKLLLVVSEVTEMQDCLRNGEREEEQEELADVFIRLLDYAAWRGFDVDTAITAKMEKNRSRSRLHGRAVF